MKCQKRDADLLLLGLGELGSAKRLLTTWHLQRCPRCQARQAELLKVSGLMADALRPVPAAKPLPPVSLPRVSPALPRWILFVLVAGLVAVGSFWYVRVYLTPPPAAQDLGCRPDLPNDQCR